MSISRLVAAVAIVAPLAVAGCAHERRPKIAEVETTSAYLNYLKTDQEVAVDDDLRNACKIDDTEKTPKFDYDSSSLSSADRNVLVQIAKCLTTGPLKGRSVELTGRADPRGETEYNMSLGSSRAAAVNMYLSALGVDPSKMPATSRGELDARGKDEDGWRKDRRVDMRLFK